MLLQKGEVRIVGIEVISQVQQDFIIEGAEFAITQDGEVIEKGEATVDGHKIFTLFSANETGRYLCEFTYRIGPEVLKAKVIVEVR
jgi:hypothetical protein